MTYRITKRDLENSIMLLNQLAGFAPGDGPYVKNADGTSAYVNNRLVPVAGYYVLDGAYGGWKLGQMTEGGGERNVLSCGYKPKRECFELMQAFISGFQAKGKNDK